MIGRKRRGIYFAWVMALIMIFASIMVVDAGDMTTFAEKEVYGEDKDTASQMNDGIFAEKDTISITMSFAGDCTLGSDLTRGKAGSFMEVFERQADPYNYFFKNVREIFENDDLTVVNLEGALTNSKARADKEFSFKGLPEFSKILKSGGIEAVSLANNHTMDYGKQGYEDTIESLKEAGIDYFDMNTSCIREIKGVKVGLLGYKAWSFDEYMKNKIAGDIARLKKDGVSLIVVSFHSGIERDYYPDDVQKKMFTYAVDQGADLVVGHHPHVLQGIEEYDGKYIVYSLGNFCFGGNRNPKDKDSVIFQQTFELDSETLAITGKKAAIYPCSVTSSKSGNNFQPTLLTGNEADRVIQNLTKYSAPLDKSDSGAKFISTLDARSFVDDKIVQAYAIADKTNILYDGNALEFDTPILYRDGVNYIPVKPLLENMDATVTWDEEQRAARAVLYDREMIFKVEAGGILAEDAQTFIYKGRTYAPIKYIADLGFSVSWHDETKTVHIEKGIDKTQIIM